MRTIETLPGDHIYNVCVNAIDAANLNRELVQFDFNGHTLTVNPGDSIADVGARWKELSGLDLRTPSEDREAASKRLADMEAEQAKAITDSKVLTELELREADVPWLKTAEELNAYIAGLVDRPHDYGTCVYAMSMSSVATLRYVASKLGVTGFQASCADMDIVRRLRNMEGGFRILDYSNLLYPQYCDDEHFPSWEKLLADPKVLADIAGRAEKKLAENASAHPSVRAHWEKLVAMNSHAVA